MGSPFTEVETISGDEKDFHFTLSEGNKKKTKRRNQC